MVCQKVILRMGRVESIAWDTISVKRETLSLHDVVWQSGIQSARDNFINRSCLLEGRESLLRMRLVGCVNEVSSFNLD